MRRICLGALAALLVSVAVCAAASGPDMKLTVAKLAAFIESSVKLKLPDKQVAEYLRNVKLTEKLEARMIEDFQGMGAGPRTIAALERLRDESAPLKEPPPPAEAAPPPRPKPPPDSIEQAKIIEAAREYALTYTKQLPNFICAEVTRRYWDRTNSESWALLDTITSKLSFFDQQEKYEVVGVSGHREDTPLDRLGGTMTYGEFGSQLKEVFDPAEHADFEWARWATLRGKSQYVFSYRIGQMYSHYTMVYDNSQKIVPAYEGLVFIDRDTGLISRITLDPIGIPGDFPVKAAHTVLDYDIAKIAENEFVLPLRAEVTSKVNDKYSYMTKNDKEFRLYRKFGSETTITFTPDALPDSMTKEEPATQDQKAKPQKPPKP